MAGANTVTLTDANFEEEVIQSEQPVLVDFGAEWCGPCKALAPVIDELADEYAGKVKVGTVDIDSNHSTPARFQISAVPTLILFQGGEAKEKIVGVRSKKDLKATLDNFV